MDIGKYISTLDAPSSAGIPKAMPSDYGADVAVGLGKLANAADALDQEFHARADDLSRAHGYESAAVQASQGLGALENDLATAPDWRTHEDRWRAGFTKLKEDVLAPINDPLVQTALTRKFGEMESAGILRAKAASRALFMDEDKASLITTLRDTKQTALAAKDDVEESAILGIGIGALTTRANRGSIDQETATKGTLAYLKDYYEAKGNRDIDHDPDKFAQDLLDGKYTPFLDQTSINRLEEKYVRVKDKIDRDLEKLSTNEEKRRDSAALTGALFGEITREDLDRRFRARLLSTEGYEAATRVLSKNWEAAGVSDPTAHFNLLTKIYVSPQTVTPGQIAALRSSGQLSGKDAADATKTLMDRQETMGGIKDPRYNDGISKITKSISKGPMEVLSAPAARTLVLDIIEFEDRVLERHEDPKVVSDEIALRNEQNQTGLLKAPILPYRNVNELNAARRSGEVSPKMYESYLRILNKQTAKPPAPAGKKSSLGE
jgi:hypothetical protein